MSQGFYWVEGPQNIELQITMGNLERAILLPSAVHVIKSHDIFHQGHNTFSFSSSGWLQIYNAKP